MYSGNNYFYEAKISETGMTLPEQREFFDDIITKVMNSGTKVISHGPTKLENSIKQS